MTTQNATVPKESTADNAPAKAKIILATLIIVAVVANLPLAMANVALPSIGAYFDASQTQLNLVAVAYSFGLACSVLWLGALGDHYGRKQMAMLGVGLAIPAGLICALAPSIQVLIAVLLGVALVFFMFPKHDEEKKLLAEYHEQDMAAMAVHQAAPPASPGPDSTSGA